MVLAVEPSSTILHAVTADGACFDVFHQMLPDDRICGGDLLDSSFERLAHCGAGSFWYIGECPAAAPKPAFQSQFARQRFELFLLVY
jgi:hypothetical protein